MLPLWFAGEMFSFVVDLVTQQSMGRALGY